MLDMLGEHNLPTPLSSVEDDEDDYSVKDNQIESIQISSIKQIVIDLLLELGLTQSRLALIDLQRFTQLSISSGMVNALAKPFQGRHRKEEDA